MVTQLVHMHESHANGGGRVRGCRSMQERKRVSDLNTRVGRRREREGGREGERGRKGGKEGCVCVCGGGGGESTPVA
jgi:hypothetical protein